MGRLSEGKLTNNQPQLQIMSTEAVADAPVNEELSSLIDSKFRMFKEGSIVNGTILDIRPQVVIVDIGYKSEGVIPASEFPSLAP